ncbi:MAG: endolytic transglycosylase MltG [Candidatus Sungbacteria bacterium]|nr:endolytic transglycosylase MltG [Candidatus Sungbacteria bacterium]
MIFKNRREAGEKLAQALAKYKTAADTIILALPRGGVVVGYEVSKELGLPLDIVVPRKIGAPGNPEYAVGAITETGEGVFNEDETRHIDQEWLVREIEKEKKEAERRLKLYRGDKPYPDVTGRIVILVDDGIATGFTMRAAIKSVRVKNPQKIIVAVPHGAADSLAQLRKEADEVIALEEPEWYGAVGAFYEEFGQTSDEEVIALLQDKSEKIKDKRFGYNFFVFCLLSFVFAASLAANELYRPHTSYKSSRSVEITEGLGAAKIAHILKREGVIRSKWTFVLYISLKNQTANLRPGNYVFGQASIPEIVRDLVFGGTNERVITIPEGWNSQEIAEYLGREGIVSPNEFRAYTSQSSQHSVLTRFEFLSGKPKNEGLEGYLFPDTYRIFVDATTEDIIMKMLENFGKKLTPELREEIVRRNLTVFDVVRMASMIEKEVVSDEDRALVSGILWKRLDLGMGLQVDATIDYIKKQELGIKNQGNNKISMEDTKIDSPYNTYKYRGLPEGPIGNPGLSAIRAAIYPKESPYLYYLSTPDGKTIFSKTLEEHNEAKIKFLR